MAEIALIEVVDPADLWVDLGFTVAGGLCRVGAVTLRLRSAADGVPAGGVTGWELTGDGGLVELPVVTGVERLDADRPVDLRPPHPNGVVDLDHVVVTTPDLDRTVDAFERAGVLLRRTRQAGTRADPVVQAFFKMGPVVVEVVGSSRPTGSGPARFYGLAFTVGDLDVTSRLLGDRLRPPRDAVQPGRRIATLDRSAGSTVPIAFMTPGRHVPPGGPPGHQPDVRDRRRIE